MSHVTVAQAAFLTGKSRQTINKFTKRGKLSFSLNEEQAKVIDIAELQRVFPLTRKAEELEQMELAPEREEAEEGPPSLKEQVAVLRERLENLSSERELLVSERARERRQLEAEIEHLRTSLEKAQDQHGKAMLLLTHQGEEGGITQQRQKVAALEDSILLLKQQNKRIYRELQQQKSRGLWTRLFG